MDSQNDYVRQPSLNDDVTLLAEQEGAAERRALRSFSATTFADSAKAAGLPAVIEHGTVKLSISRIKSEATRFIKSSNLTLNAVNAPSLLEAFLLGGGPKVRALAAVGVMRKAALLAIERVILETKLSRRRRGERAFFDQEVGDRVEHMSELALLEKSHFVAEARARRTELSK